MTCERCNLPNARHEAGQACPRCNYPYELFTPFRRFLTERAPTCVIAMALLQFWDNNPDRPENEIVMLALINYAGKVDCLGKVLENLTPYMRPKPIRVV